jgi:hypothetical protein
MLRLIDMDNLLAEAKSKLADAFIGHVLPDTFWSK